MSLTAVAEVRALVATTLTDAQLQIVIDRVEADITERIGAPYTDANTTISETVAGGYADLYLKRPISSVSTVTEYSSLSSESGEALTAADGDFFVWPNEGRLVRLANGGRWGARVVVAYVPADDRHKWKQAVTDLVRLIVNHQAMKAESVAGEYSYTAPDYEVEKRRILKRLSFVEI